MTYPSYSPYNLCLLSVGAPSLSKWIVFKRGSSSMALYIALERFVWFSASNLSIHSIAFLIFSGVAYTHFQLLVFQQWSSSLNAYMLKYYDEFKPEIIYLS